ncbi:MAG: hypothetical protein KY468_05950 [Armatimonadetes bacterium]|nr:hypothetical protein [Armatimonadota bacterium]
MRREMICPRLEEVRETWQKTPDGGGAGDLCEHLAACRPCREEWESLQEFSALLRRGDVAAPLSEERRLRMKANILRRCADSAAAPPENRPVTLGRPLAIPSPWNPRVRWATGLMLAALLGGGAGYWASLRQPETFSPPGTLSGENPLIATESPAIEFDPRPVRQVLWVNREPQSDTVGPVRLDITEVQVTRMMPPTMDPVTLARILKQGKRRSPEEQAMLEQLIAMEKRLDSVRRSGSPKSESTERYLDEKITSLSKHLVELRRRRERTTPRPTPQEIEAAKKKLAAMPPPDPTSDTLVVKGHLYAVGEGPVYALSPFFSRSPTPPEGKLAYGTGFYRLTSRGAKFKHVFATPPVTNERKPLQLYAHLPVARELPFQQVRFRLKDQPRGMSATPDVLSNGGDYPWKIRFVSGTFTQQMTIHKERFKDVRHVRLNVVEKTDAPADSNRGMPVRLFSAFHITPPWRLRTMRHAPHPQEGWQSVNYDIIFTGVKKGDPIPPLEIRYVPARQLRDLMKPVTAELTIPLMKPQKKG